MDSPGLAPGSPACDASVFLLDDEPFLSPKVHASDLAARHAPKDLNPDQLGWNQSCYRYTRDTHSIVSGSRETRTHKSRSRPPVFKTGSSSGRMASVSCGSWNRTNGLLVQSQASLPTATTPHRSLFSRHMFLRAVHKLRGQDSNLRTRGSKPRISADRNYPASRVPCGSRTHLAGLEARCLCRSAKDT